jgi:hypothetical protein
MMAVPARFQYRLMRDVMVAAGVLYLLMATLLPGLRQAFTR